MFLELTHCIRLSVMKKYILLFIHDSLNISSTQGTFFLLFSPEILTHRFLKNMLIVTPGLMTSSSFKSTLHYIVLPVGMKLYYARILDVYPLYMFPVINQSVYLQPSMMSSPAAGR